MSDSGSEHGEKELDLSNVRLHFLLRLQTRALDGAGGS